MGGGDGGVMHEAQEDDDALAKFHEQLPHLQRVPQVARHSLHYFLGLTAFGDGLPNCPRGGIFHESGGETMRPDEDLGAKRMLSHRIDGGGHIPGR